MKLPVPEAPEAPLQYTVRPKSAARLTAPQSMDGRGIRPNMRRQAIGIGSDLDSGPKRSATPLGRAVGTWV